MEYGVQLAGGAAQLRPKVLGLLLQTAPRPLVCSQQEVTLLQALLGCRQSRLHTTIFSLTMSLVIRYAIFLTSHDRYHSLITTCELSHQLACPLPQPMPFGHLFYALQGV